MSRIMQPTDKHKIFKGMPLEQFKNSIEKIHPLGNECWASIEPLIYIKELDKNEYYSKEGQLTKDLGFIAEGILRIYYLNEKGEEWNKHFLQENDFVVASISPEKKSITNIQALSKVRILSIPYVGLMELADKYNQINIFIQKLTFKYLEQKQEREIRLLSEDALNNYLMFKESFPDFENQIPHYHIASYLGITPTQLSRLRKKIYMYHS